MVMPDILIGTFQISNQKEMDLIVKSAIEAGVRGFDTAPSYGTEYFLGSSIATAIAEGWTKREDLFIQDKIDAIQMYKCKKKGVKSFVLKQIEKLHITYLDALLIHWPFSQYINETWNEMLYLKEEGYVRKIGVCNLDERGFKSIFRMNGLNNVDIIQNEISPLNTDQYNTAFFRCQNFIIQAYSPFCRMNKIITEDVGLKKIAIETCSDIGQVILKWHIQNGIHPIFLSKKPERIKNNLKLDFELSKKQMEYISNMNQDYKIFPISHGCPGY